MSKSVTKAALSRRVNEQDREIEELNNEISISGGRIDRLIRAREEAEHAGRSTASRLKGEIARLREENASLRGYLQAVHDERRPRSTYTVSGPNPEEDHTPSPLRDKKGRDPRLRTASGESSEERRADWFDL